MIQIIPAIDIMNGKCVRLSQGDFLRQKIYDIDPLEMAKKYEDIGIKRLHIVDLDGARSGSLKNIDTLRRITVATSLIIDYGGGIRTSNDVAAVLDAGAAMINISSIAVKEPQVITEWIATYGAGRILIGADVKNERIAINGWLDETCVELLDFLQENSDKGISQFFCTDVAHDGMLAGPSLELFARITASFPAMHFIASGGVAALQDIQALQDIGCSGVIIGKAIYEGRITLTALKDYIANGTN